MRGRGIVIGSKPATTDEFARTRVMLPKLIIAQSNINSEARGTENRQTSGIINHYPVAP